MYAITLQLSNSMNLGFEKRPTISTIFICEKVEKLWQPCWNKSNFDYKSKEKLFNHILQKGFVEEYFRKFRNVIKVQVFAQEVEKTNRLRFTKLLNSFWSFSIFTGLKFACILMLKFWLNNETFSINFVTKRRKGITIPTYDEKDTSLLGTN